MFNRVTSVSKVISSRLSCYMTDFVVPKLAQLEVIPVPCLKDNYAYILRDVRSNAIGIIDGVDPKNVCAMLEELHIKKEEVGFIFTTHRHYDHEGGNTELSRLFPTARIFLGPEPGNYAYKYETVNDGDVIKFGDASVTAIHTPCHTTGHICYHAVSGSEGVVFTGDTQFLGGCGRFFEGTKEDMFNSFQKLKKLPEHTHVYSGHEYTASNLKFCKAVEPANEFIKARINAVQGVSNTHPSTIGEELRTNVFFRSTTAEQLGDYRSQKDRF